MGQAWSGAKPGQGLPAALRHKSPSVPWARLPSKSNMVGTTLPGRWGWGLAQPGTPGAQNLQPLTRALIGAPSVLAKWAGRKMPGPSPPSPLTLRWVSTFPVTFKDGSRKYVHVLARQSQLRGVTLNSPSWSRMIRVQVSVLLFACYVTSEKSFHLPELPFPHLQDGTKEPYPHLAWGKGQKI